MALARVLWEMRFNIRSFLLLLMAETLKVSPLLILSIRDSRSFRAAGNKWWNDSRAMLSW